MVRMGTCSLLLVHLHVSCGTLVKLVVASVTLQRFCELGCCALGSNSTGGPTFLSVFTCQFRNRCLVLPSGEMSV